MGIFEIVLGSIIVALAIVLVICVLLQSGKDKKLSGAITGSAETFFSKGRGKQNDKIFAAITTVLGFVFVVLVVVLYIAVARV